MNINHLFKNYAAFITNSTILKEKTKHNESKDNKKYILYDHIRDRIIFNLERNHEQ